jgi:plastocyanin
MWTVKLTPGTYKFMCDPHKATMKGSFKVTQ